MKCNNQQSIQARILPSYASVTKSSNRQTFTNTVAHLPPRLVDPERSVIVTNINNPRQFSNPIVLKKFIADNCPEALPHISTGKITASGKLLLEATTPESFRALQDVLKPVVFGAECTRCAFYQDVCQCQHRGGGTTSTVHFFRRSSATDNPNRISECHKGNQFNKGWFNRYFEIVKVDLTNLNEANRILSHGGAYWFSTIQSYEICPTTNPVL